MARSSHGRKPLYSDPEVLWDACCEYFEWNEANPLWESKLVSFQGESKVEILPKMRAMTISAMTMFIGMDQSTWEDYRRREDFVRVTKEVEQIIYNQKFTGASADLLNANIIARELGLKDQSSREVSGPGGGPVGVITAKMTPEEASQHYIDLLKDPK
jgi:hypothetical protein